MKHWKKGLCGLLAAVLMVPAGLAAPVSGGKNLSDLEGHWAQKEVEVEDNCFHAGLLRKLQNRIRDIRPGLLKKSWKISN